MKRAKRPRSHWLSGRGRKRLRIARRILGVCVLVLARTDQDLLVPFLLLGVLLTFNPRAAGRRTVRWVCRSGAVAPVAKWTVR